MRRPFEGSEIFTVGHSTRPLEELVDILWSHGIATLADIRTVPRSRHNPQFNATWLAEKLPHYGIAYAHVKELGGVGSPGTELEFAL